MKNILTVIKFEYAGFVKAKSFRIMSVLFVVLILGASFIPQIISAVKDGGSGEKEAKTNAVFLLTGDAVSDTVATGAFTSENLAAVLPGTKWTDGNAKDYTENDLKKLIEDGTFSVAISYGDGVGFKYFMPGNDLSLYQLLDPLSGFITEVSRQQAISKLPPELQQSAADIATISAPPEIVSIGGDAQNNFWIGYSLMFLLFYMVMGYSSFVSTAIVSEKTSKAMELLISAAKPLHLMVGKVIGVGLAALTQMALIIAAGTIGIMVNLAFWKSDYPALYGLITTTNVSPALVTVLVLFFFLGFFLFAFIFAALASTVSKAEEAASVTTLPMLLMVVAFMIGILSLSGMLNKTLVAVLSYIPFFTPFVMVSRYCLGDVTMAGVAIGVLVLAAGVGLVAWLAAKIYRIGVMMYGKPMKLPAIFKALRQG